LFVFAILLFASGVVVRFVIPTIGAGAFTLWALLLVLGFISTIGGVTSWTLATDPSPVPGESPRGPAAPTYLPIPFPEAPTATMPTEKPSPARARSEFGRPAPDTRSAPLVRDWYEGPTDSTGLVGREYPPPTGGRSPAEATVSTVETPEPVESVLAALEGIERDLAPRNRTDERAPA
jgi:hypothetical protein